MSLGGGLQALRNAGFRSTDVSVLMPENAGTKDFVHEKDTKAPEGATTGAASGVVIGGVLGWLVGMGALAIPGLGPFIAAGPIVAMLAGAGAVGTVGGLVGSLIGLGMPEYEAKRYEGRVKSGGILLSVHCDDANWVKRAKTILEETGAEDISSSGEAKADYAMSDRPGSESSWYILDQKGGSMLYWAVVFLVIALVAAIFGFTGVEIAAAGVAKILFLVFLVLFVVSLVGGLARRV